MPKKPTRRRVQTPPPKGRGGRSLVPLKKTSRGRGGPRQGAGRPRRINWREVRRYAYLNASEEDIVTALQIPPEVLKDQEVSARLRKEVDVGNAQYRLKLREQIHKRGIKEGSVNVLLGDGRNTLGWDQPAAQTQEPVPDVNEAQLLELLARLKAGGGPYGAPAQGPSA